MRKTIVAVDFDGTICEHRFPNIGKVKEGAVEAIKKLKEDGVIIILWTCRYDSLLEEAVAFCHSVGIYPDHINTNYSGLPFETSSKIYADYYIDDRAYGTNWEKNYEIISKHAKEPFIKV